MLAGRKGAKLYGAALPLPYYLNTTQPVEKYVLPDTTSKGFSDSQEEGKVICYLTARFSSVMSDSGKYPKPRAASRSEATAISQPLARTLHTPMIKTLLLGVLYVKCTMLCHCTQAVVCSFV